VGLLVTLGIAPGVATVGYGVVQYENNRFLTLDYGVITTKPGELSERLLWVNSMVRKLIQKYSPEVMAVEELFFNTNAKTALQGGHGRGVILLAAAEENVKVRSYTPLQVKQSVVGYGRAEKIQVMQMVKTILKLEKVPKPDDAADALALAICDAHSQVPAVKPDGPG
jgi:crossover junction endodeoxyribonuclease RuvC